ncbi:MAG: N-acetyl-alpha-D-glucosaminyl L-malate synthase BshA [Verrucomicrobiota bacterium]|nr:N-acetyl-alpha-D-glucosaminyl L-malate synthase BshA [Verrucomicrobiota bacterium]
MDSPSLRIGITCFPLIGGSGILATALGTDLAARGHEVHFFSYAKPVRLDLTAPRIHFHEVAVGENSLFPCPDYTLPLAVRMADVARSAHLDVLHSHYAVPHAIAAHLAAEMIGKTAPKLVTTLHGTDTNLLGRDPAYRPAIEHALICSDAVTTVSESLRGQTMETFRLRRDIEVIPNFFAPAPPARTREEVRAELGVGGDFLVVHMSNLRRVKRIDLLLRTFASARNREAMRLLILAGGSFAPYETLLDELGIRERVIVKASPVAVEDYLRAADSALYTSEIESFGLSILESMFCAKPVVAFGIGGIPEVVGDTGCLEAFGDRASLAAALDRLLETPQMARDLGERARVRAEQRFSAAKVVPLYEALYRRVVA